VGSWSLPGGKVHPGERLQEALHREMLEETGLSVVVGPLLEVVEILREGFHYVVIDYLCTPLGDADMALASDDASELRWVTAEAARSEELSLTPDVLRVIDRGLTAWSGQGKQE
jgi:ADP-ribose pyrophosphatase YjhB (NUDIX family)